MLFQVHPETVGVQAKFLRHLCHGHSTLFQSGYGVSVFGGSGRVIFPNGRPVHGLAFLVRDAFALTNQVLVPSLQVVVETSYRYAGLFGYFSGCIDCGAVGCCCSAVCQEPPLALCAVGAQRHCAGLVDRHVRVVHSAYATLLGGRKPCHARHARRSVAYGSGGYTLSFGR